MCDFADTTNERPASGHRSKKIRIFRRPLQHATHLFKLFEECPRTLAFVLKETRVQISSPPVRTLCGTVRQQVAGDLSGARIRQGPRTASNRNSTFGSHELSARPGVLLLAREHYRQPRRG